MRSKGFVKKIAIALIAIQVFMTIPAYGGEVYTLMHVALFLSAESRKLSYIQKMNLIELQ